MKEGLGIVKKRVKNHKARGKLKMLSISRVVAELTAENNPTRKSVFYLLFGGVRTFDSIF